MDTLDFFKNIKFLNVTTTIFPTLIKILQQSIVPVITLVLSIKQGQRKVHLLPIANGVYIEDKSND